METDPADMSLYFDHNATTPLRREARDLWLKVSDELGGNPSSLHRGGRRARAIIDEARERVAAALGVHEGDVIFTSGGTEADNLALFGVLGGCGRPPQRAGLVTSAVEHAAVLEPARALARRGHPLAVVGVDREGLPDPDELLRAAGTDTALVSLHAANNELGTLPELARVGQSLRERGPGRPWFHTDAVQALGRIPIDLAAWGADLASFSAHKVGGPVGCGVLLKRGPVPLEPLFFGGGQEEGYRPGTEDAAGIAATALAIELAVAEREGFRSHTEPLCGELWSLLRARRAAVELLGPPLGDPRRLPNTLTLLLTGVEGRVLVTRLGMEGLALSAGSACSSGSLEPSHVLRALGFDDTHARSALRLSLGWNTNSEDCKRAADILCATIPSSHAT